MTPVSGGTSVTIDSSKGSPNHAKAFVSFDAVAERVALVFPR
jgi:hypothetical protein